MDVDASSSQIQVMVGEEELEIPEALTEDREIFRSVLSVDSWKHLLSEEDKERLKALAPNDSILNFEEALRFATSTNELRFGANPVDALWEKLASGSLAPGVWEAEAQRKRLLLQQYKFSQADYYVQLLQELLVSRQVLLQQALSAGSLENMWKGEGPGLVGGAQGGKEGRERKSELDLEYERVLKEIAGECSDEDEDVDSAIDEEEYRRILRGHRKHRRNHTVRYLSELEHLGGGGVVWDMVRNGGGMVTDAPPTKRSRLAVVEEGPLVLSTSFPPRKHPRAEQEVGVGRKEASSAGGGRRGRRTIRERSQHEGTTLAQARAIYQVYTPIDNGVVKDLPIQPIILVDPLPEGKFKSFFSLLKAVFDSINDRKGELGKLTKAMSQLIRSHECADCAWLSERSDWVELTLSALCYLSAEVGAVSSFDALPHFVPVIEFRDRVDNWKWIGSGRDSELDLLVLCNHWLENLDQALPVVDYSDYEPPPPHVWTNNGFQHSTPEEITKFQQQERERYSAPHKAYTYNIRGYESPVGPVKGARMAKRDSSSKARGHALLVSDRPNCVTILSLVRDATSRLPNGEGTRLDLCIQVQDSQFIADFVSETQLNNAVSGALDRLHYEKDPCVRYDGTRKVWIYLHRGRDKEDFERIHWACEVASKQRKTLTSRPKIKPKTILRMNGKDEVLEQGSSPSFIEESSSTSTNKIGKRASGTRAATTNQQSAENLATPTTPHLPQPGQLSLVVASIVHGKPGASHEAGSLGLTLHLSQQKFQDMDEQKHLRKRKQSLKVAELLQEEAQTEAHTPKLSPSSTAGYTPSDDTPLLQASPAGSSSSSSWNSADDSEDQGEAVVPLKSGVSLESSKGNGEGEWPGLLDDANSSD